MSLFIFNLVSPNTITETNNYNTPTPYMLQRYGVDRMRTYNIQVGQFCNVHPSVLKLAISVKRMKAWNAFLVFVAVICAQEIHSGPQDEGKSTNLFAICKTK